MENSYTMFQIKEAAVGGCFLKQVFLKSLQNHRKRLVLESLFNKAVGF